MRTDRGIGVALIGYGEMARLHATALRAAGARLLAVYGPEQDSAARFARRHGVQMAAPSLEAAVGLADVEVVIVASPSPVHAAQTRLVLEAGRHALVEIPLALSLSDGESLVTAAERRGLTLGVCHTLRFWEPYVALQAAIAASGTRVRHVVARRLFERRTNTGWSGRPRSWTDDLLWHHGGHTVNMALAVLGNPVVETAASVGRVRAEGGPPMDYALSLTAANGAVGSIALSYNSLIAVSDLLVLTDDETWQVSGAEARTSRALIVAGDPEETQIRAITRQDAAFISSVRGGPAFPALARTIMPTLQVLEAVTLMGRGL